MGSHFSNKAKTGGTPVPPRQSSTQHSATHPSPFTNRRSLVFVLMLGLGAFAVAYGLTKLRQNTGGRIACTRQGRRKTPGRRC